MTPGNCRKMTFIIEPHFISKRVLGKPQFLIFGSKYYFLEKYQYKSTNIQQTLTRQKCSKMTYDIIGHNLIQNLFTTWVNNQGQLCLQSDSIGENHLSNITVLKHCLKSETSRVRDSETKRVESESSPRQVESELSPRRVESESSPSSRVESVKSSLDW